MDELIRVIRNNDARGKETHKTTPLVFSILLTEEANRILEKCLVEFFKKSPDKKTFIELQDVVNEIKMQIGLTEEEETKLYDELYREHGSLSKKLSIVEEVQ